MNTVIGDAVCLHQLRNKSGYSIVDNTKASLHSISTTRWSARVEAVKSINKYLDDILQILQAMMDDTTETTVTRSDATQLYNRILIRIFYSSGILAQSSLIPIDRVQKNCKIRT